MDQLILFVNGKKVVVDNPDPETTLLQFIRNELQLKGTKLGCGEGGCGACTVMVTRYDYNDKTFKHVSVNACLAPLCSLHGLAVTTVEGLGSVKNGLHPVQERLAKSHGSQCGFCTPGFVMSMYALLCNDPQPSESLMEKALEGNLCRCTGYRPILDGFRTFASSDSKERQNGDTVKCSGDNAQCKGGECPKGGKCHQQIDTLDSQETDSRNLFDTLEFMPFNPGEHLAQPIKDLELIAEECDKQSLEFKSNRVTWYRPTSLNDLIRLKEKHPDARIVIGNTEIGIEMKFKNMHYPVLIAATNVRKLNSVKLLETGIRIGASVTLSKLADVLSEAISQYEEYKTRIFVAIVEMLRWFAGPQVRNVAAIGGSIVTASPVSDLNPLLMSAGCTLTVASLCQYNPVLAFSSCNNPAT